MKPAKTTLILGGGVGGLVTAVELRKRLPKKHRVILIERNAKHLFAPSLLWLMVGLRRAESIARPLRRLERKGIEVIRGEIEKIDPANLVVTVGNRQLTGDYIVVSLGADLAPELIPGLAGAGHAFYSLEGASGLTGALDLFNGGRVVVLTATPAYKCPAAPYEAAMLLMDYFRKRGIDKQIDVALYAAEPGPMGVTGAEYSAAVKQMVERSGVTYHPAHQILDVDGVAKKLNFSNGTVANYDLLIYVPPHRAPSVIRDAGLVGENGWVAVDRNSMETSFTNVYAIGDVTAIPLKVGKPLPKAGTFAHAQGKSVAQNIAHQITGKGQPAEFSGHGECFVETGGGKAGYGQGNFYAEPAPQVAMHKPNRRLHWGKVWFEKYWLWKWL